MYSFGMLLMFQYNSSSVSRNTSKRSKGCLEAAGQHFTALLHTKVCWNAW